MLDTPVVFIIFRRREATERVFQRISAARPRKLLVVADGPRSDRPDDMEACAATRAVTERIDWDCDVLRNYSEVNLGCGHRPATGIAWAFQHVEEAIILEDDCLPHPTFFRFCSELLERYRDDERVMVISGSNFLFGQKELPYSYYFNRNTALWGWASWRRAWQHMDRTVSGWPELRDTEFLLDVLGDPRQVEYWRPILDRAHEEGVSADDWDFQWTFSVWAQSGLGITPAVNLISNIGFGPQATHTFASGSVKAEIPTSEMEFPLRHPPYVVRDREADRLSFYNAFVPRRSSLLRRLRRKLSALVSDRVKRRIKSWLDGGASYETVADRTSRT